MSSERLLRRSAERVALALQPLEDTERMYVVGEVMRALFIRDYLKEQKEQEASHNGQSET